MTLREAQDRFIEELGMFDTWTDKFNLLIENFAFQSRELPEDLLRFRIAGCQSRTYFKAENMNGYISISGWSNSSIMAGLIVCLKKIFNGIPVRELSENPIDFHVQSGLIDNLTPMRKAAVMEMTGRISVLSLPLKK
jgi:sulfur transfer protein SufE